MSNQSIPTFDNLSKPLVHSKSEQHKLLCCCMLHMIEHCSLWILCLKKIKLLILTLFADVIHQVMLFQQAQTIQFFVILVFKWLFCFYSKSSPQRCFPLKSCPTPLRRAAHPSIQHFSRHVLTFKNVPKKFWKCQIGRTNRGNKWRGKKERALAKVRLMTRWRVCGNLRKRELLRQNLKRNNQILSGKALQDKNGITWGTFPTLFLPI